MSPRLRSTDSAGGLADIEHSFRSQSDREARWIWVGAASAAVVGFALLLALGPQFGDQSRNYLLSSIAQSLGAVVALAATLPLAYAGLSRYLPGAAGRLVRSPHFQVFIGLYLLTAIAALVELCYRCLPDYTVLAVLALAAGCLIALPTYFIWVADRLSPGHYLHDLLAEADRIASTTRLAGGRAPEQTLVELRDRLSTMSSVASAAAADGATLYIDWAQGCILQLWMKYDSRGVDWVTRLCSDTWSSLLLSHIMHEVFVARTIDAMRANLTRECLVRGLKPSERMMMTLSEPLSLILRSSPDGLAAASVERGLGVVAIVAHHSGHSDATLRAVLHEIAMSRLGESRVEFERGLKLLTDSLQRGLAAEEDTQLHVPEASAIMPPLLDEYDRLRKSIGAEPDQSIRPPSRQ